MDHCLRIPDIIRIVCGGLDGTSAYTMALVARRFRDPALDIRWRDLTSFVPIVKCLPDDLWTVHEAPVPRHPGAVSRSKILDLQRGLVPADLQRYMEQYAHRIRSIRPKYPSHGMWWVSSQVLHALQVATDFKPGALSPRLEAFDWNELTPELLKPCVGSQVVDNLSPCMTLFLGPTLKHIELSLQSDGQTPLHFTTILCTPKRLPFLKELYLGLENPEAPLDRLMESSSWEFLEVLRVYWAPERGEMAPYIVRPSAIRLLAAMPRLRRLQLHDVDFASPTPYDKPPSGFPSLTSLLILSERLTSSVTFFNCLPPGIALSDLTKVRLCAEAGGDLEDAQTLISAITAHCSPLTLKSVVVSVEEGPAERDEQLDFDEWSGLDITPLLSFNELTDLDIQVPWNIQLSPNLIIGFPAAWPNMKQLTLPSSTCTSAQIPSIGPSHLLALVQGLPQLKALTLAFDATRLVGDEVAPAAPFRLESLNLAHSPISSPSRTLRFLKANFSLARAPIADFCSRWRTPLFEKRWKIVMESWSA